MGFLTYTNLCSNIGEVRSEQAAAIYGPVRNGWSAALISPGKAIFGATIKFQLFILLIALGDLLLIYIVTHTLISRTLLPLTEVTYLAKNVAKGNFKVEIPQVEGSNEMFHLHEALRNMLRSINDYIKQLRATTLRMERPSMFTPRPIWLPVYSISSHTRRKV